MSVYQFGLLREDRSPDADAHNDLWLGDSTLGVEVTVERLAARCGLGNYMHGEHFCAAEMALMSHPPRAGAKLVANRPDSDAFCTMSIIELMALRRSYDIDKYLVSWISLIDRLGPTEASVRARETPNLVGPREQFASRAIHAVSKSATIANMSESIQIVSKILTGELSEAQMKALIPPRRVVPAEFPSTVYESVAFIEAPGYYNEARQWADKNILGQMDNIAVVIVHDPEIDTPFGRVERYTLIFREGAFNADGFTKEAISLEAEYWDVSPEELTRMGIGWGGHNRLLSSPRGAGNSTKIPKSRIIMMTHQFVLPKGRIAA